jgi:tetratricopeptide (TPR) repeat protein
MKIFSFIRIMATVVAAVAAAGGSVWADEATNAIAPLPVSTSARENYNAGVRLLAAKKYADAEQMFQVALKQQDERVQPMAMYDVGQTRFYSGLERLKKGPDAQKSSAQGNTAMSEADQAIHHAETALASNNMNDMIDAYLEGRGARHDLREAEKAVSAAMETYGKTLDQWLRAADDFKGAAELNPSDTNAAYNAQIVERGIAKLVDNVRKMQEMMGAMGQKKQDLGKMLSKMKGQIPAQNAPPGPAGDDDDEDQQGVTPDSLTGQKEGASRQGDQMQISLSPDQANQILNGLSLDGTKRLDMSDKEGTPPKNRNGRIW